MGKTQAEKGQLAEEQIRTYFLQLGYYVVRGATVFFQREAITDVDLWLYARPSPLSRERTNVDIKRQRNPKALERVLWAQALQRSLGLDRCIVVTTDRRPLVKEYAQRQGVLVLDGHFWRRLATNQMNAVSMRVSEENLSALIKKGREDSLQGKWRARLDLSKARLLTSLDFNGINGFLREIGFFAEQVAARRSPEVACRLMYLNTSYFLIALDFVFRLLAYEDRDTIVEVLEEGFRFGEDGRERMTRLVDLSRRLIANYTSSQRPTRSQLELELKEELSSLPVDSLAEFFSRSEIRNTIFQMAIELEDLAYSVSFTPPEACDPNLKSVFGIMVDFHNIDRGTFFRAFGPAPATGGSI